ncbi:hypothetical protein [Delftia sp. WSY_22]|uniref:hypothetical protein n=1 Tax=Delftia sp. WSY_22 TaxID=3367213 RepID=UPI00370A6372
MDSSTLQRERMKTVSAVFNFFFSSTGFADIAARHTLAINTADAINDAKFRVGEWPDQSELDRWASINDAELPKLRSEFWRSGLSVLVISAVAVILCFSLGIKISDITLAKWLAASGGGLAAWGTIFQLSRAPATWGADTVWELMRPPLFLLLFVPGSVLAIAGTLA